MYTRLPYITREKKRMGGGGGEDPIVFFPQSHGQSPHTVVIATSSLMISRIKEKRSRVVRR